MLPLLNMEAPAPSPQSGGKSPHHQLMRTVSISVLVMSLPVLYVSFLHVPPASLFRDTTFWFLMSNSIIIVIAADSGMLFFGSSSSSADDGGGIPFAVVPPSAGVKTGLSVISDEVVVQDQALVVTMEHGGDHRLPVIAENDDDLAYALVVREDRAERVVASTPESREIIVSPSSPAAEVVAIKNVDVGAGAVLPGTRPTSRLTASRSLAAREERPPAAAATRRRHGHGHRPSHSHALVPVQDKSVVVSEEKRLRRAATTDKRPSSPEVEENEKESEYSRLSDEELNRRVEEFITRFNREIRLQVEMEQAAAA